MSHVPLSSGKTIPFCPAALGTIVPGSTPPRTIPHPDIEFYLRVPNWEDRDLMALRMYSMGVRDVTADQVQAMIVSEIFTVLEPDKADEQARMLEGFWTRQQQYQRDLQDWAEQEALRRSDERESGREFEATPPPAEVSTPRERAEVNILVAEVTDGSERLRRLLADQQLYATRFKHTVLRLQLAGWKGLSTEARFDHRLVLDTQVMSRETIEALRGEIMQIDSTGAAWDELCVEAEAQFDLPRSAEKNLSSPPESTSPPDGSPTTSSGSATSDGSSISSEATDAPAT